MVARVEFHPSEDFKGFYDIHQLILPHLTDENGTTQIEVYFGAGGYDTFWGTKGIFSTFGADDVEVSAPGYLTFTASLASLTDKEGIYLCRIGHR